MVTSVTVRHVYGGVSTLLFKSYDQGRIKFARAASCDINLHNIK